MQRQSNGRCFKRTFFCQYVTKNETKNPNISVTPAFWMLVPLHSVLNGNDVLDGYGDAQR